MKEGVKRRGSKAAQRREEILDAALLCFREKGFHAASMSYIAKAFGMSAGHIYNYFNSKEDIIGALVARWLKQYISETLIVAEKDPEIQKERLYTIVYRELDKRINSGNKALLFEIAAESLRNEKIARIIRSAEQEAANYLTQQALERYQALNRKPPKDLVYRLAVGNAIFNGLCFLSISRSDLSLEALTPIVVQLLMNLDGFPIVAAEGSGSRHSPSPSGQGE